MRIVLINTNDHHGGAARAAYRLHKGLREIGEDSTYFVKQKTIDDPSIQQFIPDPSPQQVSHRKNARAKLDAAYNLYKDTRSPDIELFSQEQVDGDEDFFIQRPSADIINLHWVARFVDYHKFFTATRTKCPVVWTLHDMNTFTGGCHYDQGCEKYTDVCGVCPLLGSNEEHDLARQVFDAKKRIFDSWPREMLHIVAPSIWLTNQAKKSTLLSKFDSTTIPNGIETDIFRPLGKSESRAALNLPQDAKIVLFVSNHIGLARKGFRELVHALSLVPDNKDLMLLGVGDSHVLDIDAPFRIGQIDFLNNDHTTALLYSAADLTALPSKQDNLPNIILESMSCGTPIVGFDAGGIPDIIRHKENGFLGRAGSVGALASAISEALSDLEALSQCGERARSLMQKEYSLSTQGVAYKKLYESVIETARASRH
ncbi:MAG: glycosyltransferase family 4 protein [Rhodospirillaceae bacterium]